MNFDGNFLACVTANVLNIFNLCIEDPSLALCAPLEYDEVVCVCSSLNMGVSGIVIDYEHIRFTGPTLQRHLFLLYRVFFQTCCVPENFKTKVILPLFKGKEAKANNKDNYRRITLSPKLAKKTSSFLKCSSVCGSAGRLYRSFLFDLRNNQPYARTRE